MVEHIITSWPRRWGNKLKISDLPPLVIWDWEIKETTCLPSGYLGFFIDAQWLKHCFTHSPSVSDKCLIPYRKRSRETNCPDLSGTTQSLALKVPYLRKLPEILRQTNQVVTLNIQDRCLFSACKGHASTPTWDFKWGSTWVQVSTNMDRIKSHFWGTNPERALLWLPCSENSKSTKFCPPTKK